MVVIVDYGVGNLASLINMFEFIGVESMVSHDADVVALAECLVLPGVGAFDSAIRKLNASGLVPALEKSALERKVPVLGVCLGMQLLGQSSDEGTERGLGWIDATCHKICSPHESGLKVPNNGWLDVFPRRESPLFPDLDEKQKFYFNHSFYMVCRNDRDVAAEVDYGEKFCCAIVSKNIHGVQFHPEKSHQFGMRLLANFAGLGVSDNA